MRLVHFADLHIGVETHGRPDPADGLSTRLHDFLRVFDDLVQTAIDERVDLVIFAGDAYKARDPSQTHQRAFAARIRRLTAAGVAVYLLVGNHDVPNMAAKASALDIFGTLAVPGVTVGRGLDTQTVGTRSGPVQVVGVAWPNVSTLLTRDDTRGLGLAEIDRRLEQAVADGIAREAAALDPGLPAILTAHIAMADSIVKTASEQIMTVGRFPQLLQSHLSPTYFDYVALGHHHCYQVLRQQPPVLYAGSLERIDFGEEHDPKGFVTFELDPAKPRGQRVSFESVRFREVAARRFVTVDVAPTADDPTAEVVTAIEQPDVRGAIVRVRLTLTPEQNAALDDGLVRAALADAHTVASVARTVERRVRRRVLPLAESASPLDALAAYFEATDLPAERREVLLGYAQTLLDGEPTPPAPGPARGGPGAAPRAATG